MLNNIFNFDNFPACECSKWNSTLTHTHTRAQWHGRKSNKFYSWRRFCKFLTTWRFVSGNLILISLLSSAHTNEQLSFDVQSFFIFLFHFFFVSNAEIWEIIFSRIYRRRDWVEYYIWRHSTIQNCVNFHRQKHFHGFRWICARLFFANKFYWNENWAIMS